MPDLDASNVAAILEAIDRSKWTVLLKTGQRIEMNPIEGKKFAEIFAAHNKEAQSTSDKALGKD